MALKLLVVMSHRLPKPVLDDLGSFVVSVEDRLQAEGHKVSVAMAEHTAFGVGWVETDLTRALICETARSLGGSRFRPDELGNGGVELVHVHRGVERRFRLRRAKRDAYGALQVVVNSDSILTGTAREVEATLTLFGDSEPEPVVASHEQWVLAYLLHPVTRTFVEVIAGRVVGLLTSSPPYRLRLTDLAEIPFIATPPSNFPGAREDLDLDKDDEREGGTEETG